MNSVLPQQIVPSPDAADLTACDLEPIHIPGSIQPYGALLVLAAPSLRVLQVSANYAAIGGREPDAVLGRPLADILPAGAQALIGDLEHLPPDGSHYLRAVELAASAGAQVVHAIAHRSDALIILELEERAGRTTGSFEDVYPLVRGFVEALHQPQSVAGLCDLAAREVRRITGFDRVLIYRFDEAWNGTVLAENRNDELPSYLDLRFPASDIPAQARDLYRRNRLRLIADVDYRPVPIVPAISRETAAPLDLSLSVLRSVSPVHLEYMRNMGTAASMSVSLLCGGRLWGLISCHNRLPLRAQFHVRAACDHLAQIMALQIQALERGQDADQRMDLRAVQVQLLAQMAEEPYFLDGLTKHPDKLLGFAEAEGAAVVFAGQCRCIGRTPSEQQIAGIVQWLIGHAQRAVYATDRLSEDIPEAAGYKDLASGLLAIAISQIHPGYVLWFRPEVVQTVKWSGDPHSAKEAAPADPRIHPRKSFELWKEIVRNTSIAWSKPQIAAADELRASIVGIVLRKAEELAAMAGELEKSNKELEAFSYSVSHDLRAPFRHIVGFAELLKEREAERLSERGQHYVASIIEAAFSAGTLVDNLLSFSHLGRTALSFRQIAMDDLVRDAIRRVESEAEGRRIEWKIGKLPAVKADPGLIRLVLQNLLSNAIKFSKARKPAIIEIEAIPGAGEITLLVRDNGAGFNMAYVQKLFGVFQRLHHAEDFEGTGIGLANVKRIVERHGGRVWAEGIEDRGATFFFTLPDQPTTDSPSTDHDAADQAHPAG